jgi:hypothetical protein
MTTAAPAEMHMPTALAARGRSPFAGHDDFFAD